jgi:hypothetical protein
MSIGGWIIEALPYKLSTEGGRACKVIRLWCMDRDGNEVAVYAKPYAEGEGPKVGDEIWWHGCWIHWDHDKRKVMKIGYSFKPRGSPEP